MDKFYRVFVSSTFLDLVEERQAVMQALLSLDCVPSGMEMFPASDETAWKLIQREMSSCDYYICIVAGRYGSCDAEGVGYTEREYDEAVRLGLPVLGFVHEDASSLALNKSEGDPNGQARLSAFKKKLEARLCKRWRNADDLSAKVSATLHQMFKVMPREGWVRGGSSAAAASENNRTLRAHNAELVNQLKSLDGLHGRVAELTDLLEQKDRDLEAAERRIAELSLQLKPLTLQPSSVADSTKPDDAKPGRSYRLEFSHKSSVVECLMSGRDFLLAFGDAFARKERSGVITVDDLTQSLIARAEATATAYVTKAYKLTRESVDLLVAQMVAEKLIYAPDSASKLRLTEIGRMTADAMVIANMLQPSTPHRRP